jgi:hypothetical protein
MSALSSPEVPMVSEARYFVRARTEILRLPSSYQSQQLEISATCLRRLELGLMLVQRGNDLEDPVLYKRSL